MKFKTAFNSKIIFALLMITSMLAYRRIDLTGLSLQSFFLFALAAGWMIAEFNRKRQKKILFVRPAWRSMDIMVLLMVGYELIHIVYTFFDTKAEGAIDYNLSAVLFTTVFLYYIISNGCKWKIQYFDLLIYLGLIGIGVFLFGYFSDLEMLSKLDNIFENKGMAASYVLPICIISTIMYCLCNDRLKSVFYLMTSGMGFFVLLMNHSVISLWLMTAVFFLIPLLLCPTAELVKRDMQVFFIYAFMMSNMSLLTNYTSLVPANGVYSLSKSVYVDLLLAIGGVIFFHFWEKIPESVNLHEVVLKKMYKRFCILLIMVGALFTGIIVGGDRWNALPGGMSNDGFKAFALPLVEETRQSENVLYFLTNRCGVLGAMILLIFMAMLLLQMFRNYSMEKPTTAILLLVSIVFAFQILFWVPSAATLPMYLIAALFAAFNKEEIETNS